MKYNLNIQPTHAGEPYGISYKLSILLAEYLEQRVSTDNPLLEYRISKELREKGSVDLTQEEAIYLSTIVSQISVLPFDNIIKGLILSVLQ